MINTDIQVLTDKLSHQSPETVFFIAEAENSLPLGFIHVQTGSDYYYHEQHGHIANLIMQLT